MVNLDDMAFVQILIQNATIYFKNCSVKFILKKVLLEMKVNVGLVYILLIITESPMSPTCFSNCIGYMYGRGRFTSCKGKVYLRSTYKSCHAGYATYLKSYTYDYTNNSPFFQTFSVMILFTFLFR